MKQICQFLKRLSIVTRKSRLRFLIPFGYIFIFTTIIYFYRYDVEAVKHLLSLMPFLFLFYNVYLSLHDNE